MRAFANHHNNQKKKKIPWKEWIIYFGIDLVVHFIIYHKSKTLEGKSLFKNDFMWPRWDQSVLFKALELSNTKFFLVLFYDWMCLFQCKIFSLGESFLEFFFFFFFWSIKMQPSGLEAWDELYTQIF